MEAGPHKSFIEKRDAKFEPVGHAHEIGIAEQGIAHIARRFEIGHAIDRIEMLGSHDGSLLQILEFVFSRFVVAGVESVNLTLSEEGARQEIRVCEVAAAGERRKFAVSVALFGHQRQGCGHWLAHRTMAVMAKRAAACSIFGTRRKFE